MTDQNDDLPTSAPVETPSVEVSSEDTSTTVNLTQDEYEDILSQLEAAAAKEEGKQGEDVMLIFSKVFWDHFLTKIIVSFASVKIWILIFVLYVPVELVKKGLITGDNYTIILTIVAPLVVGLREFSKSTVDKFSSSEDGVGSKILNAIKQKFKV